MTTTASSSHPLRRLMAYAEDYRPRIALASVYSVLNKLFDLAPPVLIGMAVDVVVSQQDSFLADLGIQDVTTQLLLLGVLTAVLWGLESGFDYLKSVAWRNLAQDVQHDLRVDTYTHVQDLDMAYFEETVHRRADGCPERRHQPARALPRHRRQRNHPARHDHCRRAGRVLHPRPGRGLDDHAAHALHHLGVDPVPATPRAALRRRARTGGHAQRLPGQQPQRHRHHQELHGRIVRSRSHRRGKRPLSPAQHRGHPPQLRLRAAHPHVHHGRLHRHPGLRRPDGASTARSTSASTACWSS